MKQVQAHMISVPLTASEWERLRVKALKSGSTIGGFVAEAVRASLRAKQTAKGAVCDGL